MGAVRRWLCRWLGHKIEHYSDLFRGNHWLYCHRCRKTVDLPMRFPAATPKGGA